MTTLRSFALSSLLVILAACGGGGGDSPESNPCDALKISGGTTCDATTSPVVSLFINNNSLCSGVIAAPNAILTAAHCVVNARNIVVSHAAGSELALKASYSGYYSGDSVSRYDIATVYVSSAFIAASGASPLPLSVSAPFGPGDEVVVSGFGVDQDGNFTDSPKAAFETLSGYYDGMITAEDSSGFALSGDSGGPLVFEGGIIGVLSGYFVDHSANLYASIREPANLEFVYATLSQYAVKRAPSRTLPLVEWTPSS